MIETTIKPLASSIGGEQQIDPFNCLIYIDKEEFTCYDTVNLSQGFNSDGHFEIHLYIDPANPTLLSQIPEFEHFPGKPITIQIQKADESNNFSGIIIKITKTQQINGTIHFTLLGQSKTYYLHTICNHVYQNQSLYNILTDIEQSTQGQLIIKKSDSLYTCNTTIVQSEQSNMTVLNWLAFQHQQWVLYREDTLHIGRPNWFDKQEPIALKLGENLHTQTFHHNLQFMPGSVFSYWKDADTLYHQAIPTQIDSNKYGNYAAHHIQNEFCKNIPQHTFTHTTYQKEIEHYCNTQAAIAASNSYYITGQSSEHNLYPGSIITLNGQTYIITSIDYTFDNIGKQYYNNFTAIPNTPAVFPHNIQHIKMPKAKACLGTVVEGPNAKGEMQIRLQGSSETVWLPVAQTDVHNQNGNSKNGGIHSLPTKGTTVCIEYLYDLPCFPYISSSPSNGHIAGNANPDNTRRSIITPNHAIIFDDQLETCGITVKDIAGNSIHIQSTDDGYININAKNALKLQADNISFTSKNTNINVENLHINAQKNIDINTEKLVADGGQKLLVQGEDTTITGKRELKKLGGDITIAGNDTHLFAQDVDLNAKQKLAILSPDTRRGPNADTLEQNKPKAPSAWTGIVKFLPLENYDGEFGFDWAEWDEKGNLTKVQGTDIKYLEYIYDPITKKYLDKYVPVNQSPTALLQLRAEYKPTQLYGAPYLIPYLSMLPNQNPIKLKMKIEFLNKKNKPDPTKDYLTFDDNKYYEVSIGDKKNKKIKYSDIKDDGTIDITIKCKQPGPQQQLIARDEAGGIIGIINVLPNIQIYKPIVYVVCIVKDDPYKEGWIQDMLKRIETIQIKTIFNQALIDFEVKINANWHIFFNEDEWDRLKIFDKKQNCFRNSPQSPDNVKDIAFKKLTPEEQMLVQKNILCLVTPSYLKAEDGDAWLGGIGSTKSKTLFITDRSFDYNIPNNPRQTLQHELAHIFGLYHIFYEEDDIDDKTISKLKPEWKNAKVSINTKEKELAKMQSEYEIYKHKTGKKNPKLETYINEKIEKIQDDYIKLSNIEAEYNRTRYAGVCRNNKYKFKKFSTNNTMDFDIDTTTMGKKIYFFKWQWDIMRAEVQAYYSNDKK